MSTQGSKRVLAPLMDRLLDTNNTGAPIRPQALLTQLRESVRRDIEALFNSRSRCMSPNKNLPHLQSSLLNYGLPDLSTINFISKDNRQDFCRQIERAILNYEPRVKSAKVTIGNKVDVEDPTVRFRVEATLHANPAPETLIFDSAFNPINQSIDVAEIS